MIIKPAFSLLAACLVLASAPAHAQSGVPEAVKVPDGHAIMLETVGVGEITYECRDKANAPGQTEWTFVGPKAVLNDRSGKPVGDYFGPPATWQAKDGSKVTGTQLAVAPAAKAISVSTGQGQPCRGQGRDARGQLHPAPGDSRWRSAFCGLYGAEQRRAAEGQVPGGLRVLVRQVTRA